MEIAQDFLMLSSAPVYVRNQRSVRRAAEWGSLQARLSDESGEDGRVEIPAGAAEQREQRGRPGAMLRAAMVNLAPAVIRKTNVAAGSPWDAGPSLPSLTRTLPWEATYGGRVL